MSKTCEKCIHYDVCRYPLEYRAFPDTCWKYEEPRPHGEWIREVVVEEPRKNKRAYARCSACGCRYNHYGVAVKHFDYCPKCGADMRKEGEQK